MHDIRKIRENPEIFDENLLRRFYEPCADNILKLDLERRLKISEAEQAQAKKNIISEQVKQAKIVNDTDKFNILRNIMIKAKAEIADLELEAKAYDEKLKQYLLLSLIHI